MSDSQFTMRCPTLNELPPPQPGKTGWPWAEESTQLPEAMPDGSPWPRVSIVTPSYNQGQFIEETIRSVLLQGYPDLEYIIIDGGSTDNTVEIIKRYEPWLAYWVSEPDQGQSHAINKGFAKSTGEVMAWLNSDDKYCPWAMAIAGQIFSQFAEVKWLTSVTQLIWNFRGVPVHVGCVNGISRELFALGANLRGHPGYHGTIQQESTFWRQSLWERAGGELSTDLHCAMDFELWGRFCKFAEVYCVSVPLGGFRYHSAGQKSRQQEHYTQEAHKVFKRLGYRCDGNLFASLRFRALAWLPRLRRWLGFPIHHLRFDFASQEWKVEIKYVA